MQQVAILGLGIMGSGMAHNLLKAGFSLTVYNRSREKATALEAAGAQVAVTPRAAAEAAEVVVGMVANDEASRSIWLGDDGALAGVRSDALLIECSTLSTGWVRELAELARQRGCAFLDAPVTGSKPVAESGQLGFLVGGDSAVFERARPVLQAMGEKINHLGPVGSGATMKLINNLMGGVQLAVLAEAMLLAEQAGLDMQQVVELLSNGAPGSPMVKSKASRIAARDYETHFALRWMHKDLSYALDEATRHNVPLPTVATAREIYRLAISQGLGDQDFAALAEVLRPKED